MKRDVELGMMTQIDLENTYTARRLNLLQNIRKDGGEQKSILSDGAQQSAAENISDSSQQLKTRAKTSIFSSSGSALKQVVVNDSDSSATDPDHTDADLTVRLQGHNPNGIAAGVEDVDYYEQNECYVWKLDS